MQRMVFCPHFGQPQNDTPLAVCSVGERQLRPFQHFHEVMPERPIIAVLWGISGRGLIRRGQNEVIQLEGGWVTWFQWGEQHDLANDGDWHYLWWTMNGPQASDALRTLGWDKPGQHFAGPPPLNLFEQLFQCLGEPGKQQLAASIGYQLLLLAKQAGGKQYDHSLAQRCKALIAEHGSDPECSVNWLAQQLAVHRATLHRHCLAAWQCSVSEALRMHRLQCGLRLLEAEAESSLSIRDIAQRAGFADPPYFSREVKGHTGQSPQQWRKMRSTSG